MKKLILLSVVVAAALGFAASKAVAGTSLILNVSGAVMFDKTNFTSGGVYHASTVTKAINNKVVYNLVSNAVAHAANGVATTLPANGWLVYVPDQYDGDVYGYFYATNKQGGKVYLSGFDTNDTYYSFIELDTYSYILGDGVGFSDPFDLVYSETWTDATENGTETDTCTALLYIHDDPYDYNDAEDPDVFWNNDNAIEIRGVLKVNATYRSDNIVSGSGSLSGTGNMLVNDDNGVITSGHATF